MKFINIVGNMASGKTTFSRQLAQTLKLTRIEMDDLFWLDNWQETPDDEFVLKLQHKMDTAKEGWVLDGNYSRTLDLKLAKLDTMIWLDYSFSLNFYRSVKRAISRAISQEALWKSSNNRESFRRSFLSQESIILWMIKHHSKNRKKYLNMMQNPAYQHIQFIRLTSPKQTVDFLKKVGGM
ncbi:MULTISPECIES: adenylate kinase [unclassified Acinetobacter]|uniref:adenylate kinase n=1 Tax=unclassified Acinetobacter TaxID=196816 RepID=UPI00190B829A|nr:MULTISPECIES: adenylate kinase [unclassified Acinetobacter]MBK0064390.1 adenylate kinase [Acinetobacter sp. S55]MBK0067805.1 adenylate kinase [Acinetobacter sp. S54]